MRSALAWGTALAVYCAVPEAASAKADAPSVPSLIETVERLAERVEALERVRAEDQRRIRELEAEREPEVPSEVSGQPVEPAALPESGATTTAEAGGYATDDASIGQGNLLNPRITAFVDMGGSVSSDEDNEARNRFTLREAEVDLRAAVTPRADGVLVIAIGEEIEDPFGNTAIDLAFELEEGYLDAHTLPGDLALRAGKFRSWFGRNNRLHTHDLPQVTRPLAVQAFLGPEGLATVGASLSWLVPNPWDQYVELVAQVVNADGGAESPILTGPTGDNPAVLSHLKLFRDVGDTSSFELGSSFLYSRASGARDDGYTLGADVTYLWRDPDAPDFRSLVLQGEGFWSRGDFAAGPGSRDDYWGAYAFGQFQFGQYWYAGVRGDFTELPGVAARARSDFDWGVSGYLSWYLAEALRLRLEYQHLGRNLLGRAGSEEVLLLGLTFFIGAHPPHPYWVNR